MSERIDVQVVEDNGSTDRLTTAITRLAAACDTAQAASNRSAAATMAAGNAAASATPAYAGLNSALGRTNSSFNTLAGALGSLSIGLSVKGVVGYADAYTNMSNRLKLVSKDHKELQANIATVGRISNETRTPLAENATIFMRISDVLKNMNKDQKEAGPLLKTIAQATTLSGTAAQSAAGGLEQFQQAMGRGILRGQEFTSVSTNLPALARTIADGMGIPIGELKSMADNGKLYASTVLNAIGKMGPEIDKVFAQNTLSISSTIQVLNNSITMWVGQSNAAQSAMGGLATAILWVADNLNIVIPLVAALMAVLVIGTLAAAVSAIINLGMAFASAAVSIAMFTAANLPMIAIAIGAIGLAAGAVYLAMKQWGDQIVAMTANIPILGAAVAALNSVINGNVSPTDAAKTAADDFRKKLEEALNSLGKYTGNMEGATKSLHKYTSAQQAAGEYTNQFGEKLENNADRTARLKKENDEYYDRLEKLGISIRRTADDTTSYGSKIASTTDTLRTYSSTTSGAAGATASLGSAMSSTGSAASSMASATASASSAMQSIQADSTATINSLREMGAQYGTVVQHMGQFKSLGNVNAQTDKGEWATDYGYFNRSPSEMYGSGKGEVIQTGYVIGNRVIDVGFGMGKLQVDGNYYGLPEAKWRKAETSASQLKQLNPGLTSAQALMQGMVAAGFEQHEVNFYLQQFLTQNPVLGQEKATQGKLNSGISAFAVGGDFMVGGYGGTDSQRVTFDASPDERVYVRTPAQDRAERRRDNDNDRGRGDTYVTVQLNAQDRDSIRKTSRQVLQDFGREFARRTR